VKPKAPSWLRESFKDGVDFRVSEGREFSDGYYGCQLAQHDSLQLPCSGRLERFHWVNRQRIENAMGALLLGAEVEEWWSDWNGEEGGAGTDCFTMPQDWLGEIVLLAAWDPRVGGIACEVHHRRYDRQLGPLLTVFYDALPSHVIEWSEDWGLESQLEARCPRQEGHAKV